MEAMLWWWQTILVNQLSGATMANGSSRLWDRVHCVANPWMPCYGGGGPYHSIKCVMPQWAMVHLGYGVETIVCLTYGGHSMVVVDQGSQSIV
jgi:hypothetical protein